jgi:hypothetical protein
MIAAGRTGGRQPVLRNLTTCILLAAAFVAGYYAGRMPHSPDLVALGKAVYARASDAGQRAAGAVEHAGGETRVDAKSPNHDGQAVGPIAVIPAQRVIPLDQWGREER